MILFLLRDSRRTTQLFLGLLLVLAAMPNGSVANINCQGCPRDKPGCPDPVKQKCGDQCFIKTNKAGEIIWADCTSGGDVGCEDLDGGGQKCTCASEMCNTDMETLKKSNEKGPDTGAGSAAGRASPSGSLLIWTIILMTPLFVYYGLIGGGGMSAPASH